MIGLMHAAFSLSTSALCPGGSTDVVLTMTNTAADGCQRAAFTVYLTAGT
jgi:hypothetical protein